MAFLGSASRRLVRAVDYHDLLPLSYRPVGRTGRRSTARHRGVPDRIFQSVISRRVGESPYSDDREAIPPGSRVIRRISAKFVDWETLNDIGYPRITKQAVQF